MKIVLERTSISLCLQRSTESYPLGVESLGSDLTGVCDVTNSHMEEEFKSFKALSASEKHFVPITTSPGILPWDGHKPFG